VKNSLITGELGLDGKYFHQPDCTVVKNIREENLIGFYSSDEPKSAGLKQCGKCKSFQAKAKKNKNLDAIAFEIPRGH